MLAIVEDHQQLFAPQPLRNRLVDPPPLLLAYAQRLGDDAGDQLRIVDRSEVDEPCAVRIAIEQFGAGLDRQPRLADAARTNQREQAMMLEQPLDFGYVMFAPDERCARDGQLFGSVSSERSGGNSLGNPAM